MTLSWDLPHTVTAAVVVTALLCSGASAQSSTTFSAMKEETATRSTAAQYCVGIGGDLATDHTSATHASLMSTMRGVAGSEAYFAYLGGSSAPSTAEGCPPPADKMPSLSCAWYWDHGPFAGEGRAAAFYRGNNPPPSSIVEGLAGAGAVDGFPTFWGAVGGAPVFPNSRFQQYLVLTSVGALEGVWADTADSGGYVYGGVPNDGRDSFYSLCQFSPAGPGEVRGSGPLSTGALVGIIVGCLAGVIALVVIAILVVCCCCRGRQSAADAVEEKHSDNEHLSDSGDGASLVMEGARGTSEKEVALPSTPSEETGLTRTRTATRVTWALHKHGNPLAGASPSGAASSTDGSRGGVRDRAVPDAIVEEDYSHPATSIWYRPPSPPPRPPRRSLIDDVDEKGPLELVSVEDLRDSISRGSISAGSSDASSTASRR